MLIKTHNHNIFYLKIAEINQTLLHHDEQGSKKKRTVHEPKRLDTGEIKVHDSPKDIILRTTVSLLPLRVSCLLNDSLPLALYLVLYPISSAV